MAIAMCIRGITREMYMQGENNLGRNRTSISLGTFNPDIFRVIVISVDIRDILLRTVEPLLI